MLPLGPSPLRQTIKGLQILLSSPINPNISLRSHLHARFSTCLFREHRRRPPARTFFAQKLRAATSPSPISKPSDVNPALTHRTSLGFRTLLDTGLANKHKVFVTLARSHHSGPSSACIPRFKAFKKSHHVNHAVNKSWRSRPLPSFFLVTIGDRAHCHQFFIQER